MSIPQLPSASVSPTTPMSPHSGRKLQRSYDSSSSSFTSSSEHRAESGDDDVSSSAGDNTLQELVETEPQQQAGKTPPRHSGDCREQQNIKSRDTFLTSPAQIASKSRKSEAQSECLSRNNLTGSVDFTEDVVSIEKKNLVLEIDFMTQLTSEGHHESG